MCERSRAGQGPADKGENGEDVYPCDEGSISGSLVDFANMIVIVYDSYSDTRFK